MAELIYDEVELFTVCLLLGMVLAFFYDGIRILRLLFAHKDWVVDLEDLLFWLFTAWLVFRTLFVYNRGALRGYAFFGMFLGVVGYALTLSRFFLFLAGKFVPYWTKGKAFVRKPFIFLSVFIRKSLKNIATQVKIAIKGR
ncbi:MAG: spore cortex biosynthesis protein YabQ [Lachnospiraceae bacterium]|nr:spore cortex biosynthesis protein YabQ [Lachnospiraceae bacterium]